MKPGQNPQHSCSFISYLACKLRPILMMIVLTPTPSSLIKGNFTISHYSLSIDKFVCLFTVLHCVIDHSYQVKLHFRIDICRIPSKTRQTERLRVV